jgi:hypothetical protein
MANKKISQLAGTVPNEIVSGSYLFASAAGNVGVGYETKKITAQQIAEYVFTGSEGELGFPASQLSGTKDVYFNKSAWTSASAVVTQNPYLQVRQSDGLLVTGSGIANAVGGDNMGNCVATTQVNLQGNDLINTDDIRFENAPNSIIYNRAKSPSDRDDLMIKAGNELTLEGTTHVRISGLGLDLASIPISGAIDASLGITFTGGNIEVDPAHKLIANEIIVTGGGVGDSGALVIYGSSRHEPSKVQDSLSSTIEVLWSESNIQYDTISAGLGNLTYQFTEVEDGQTLTMYVENISTTTPYTAKFTSGTYGPDTAGSVVWGAEYNNTAPKIAENKANVYTFVRINTGIFASAVTGYVY